MKNKGISLITLIITIIVVILIASITIYTGGNMVEQSRIKTAEDRMRTVANAIASHEKELGFSNTVIGSPSGDYRLLGSDDYEIMGLEDYINEDQMPPIYVQKNAISLNDNETKYKIEYKLKTPKVLKKNTPYTEDDYVELTHVFYDSTHRENIKVEFDTVKGVNRPLLTEDMMPVKTYFDDKLSVYTEPVDDIYDEDWYDYSSTAPNWANIKMNDNAYYVWIPRFAYKVQDFYIGTDYSNIPSSAIKVIFLKENTDYMANDEVLPVGYQVHPAFKYYAEDGSVVNIPGFWVSKYTVTDLVDVVYKLNTEGDSIWGALEKTELTELHGNKESIVNQLESHLIKNTEWAAVAYLSFATAGKTDDGTSLQGNPSAVMSLNVRQFVAGVLDNTIPEEKAVNFDIYSIDAGDSLNYKTTEERQFGDAIMATSAKNSTNSAWFSGISERISTAQPFIIRGLDNNLFSYSAASRKPEIGAGCRNVLLVNP